VSELEQKFEGVVAQNVDATLDGSVTEIAALGFNNHGLVIRSSEGEVLWKQPDHEVDMDQVRKALEEILQ
jgi:hypothetical protein